MHFLGRQLWSVRLLFGCGWVLGLTSAIVSKNDQISLTTSAPATGTPGARSVDFTTSRSAESKSDLEVPPPSQRKEDYVGAASYEYGKFAPFPDYGGGKYGGGYGLGGYGYGGYDPLKGLLVPLAGVALLGAAAMFVSNPILLQLGVIGGKRRRREAISSLNKEQSKEAYEKLKDIEALEEFIEQLPQAQVMKQEKKLVANYLKCSSSLGGNRCLERLACEIRKPTSNSTMTERHVLDIVTSEMMKNEYIPKDLKQRIKKAEDLGSENGKCERYFCGEVDLS